MACFANVKVPVGEVEAVPPDKEVQHRIQNPAVIFGGKQCARFNGDDDQPYNGGDPSAQDSMLAGDQARGCRRWRQRKIRIELPAPKDRIGKTPLLARLNPTSRSRKLRG